MEYIEVGVHILGYFAALLGIYFASKPLAQNAIAIIVTVAIVFSIINSFNSIKEAAYEKQLSAQLMRSTSPASWFLGEIEDLQHAILREDYNSTDLKTTSNEENAVSITLISTQNDQLPAPLTGIATLGLIDYQDLSLLPKESLREGVNKFLFGAGKGAFDSTDVERLLLAIEIIYSAAVPGTVEKSKLIKTDKNNLVTNAQITLNEFAASFNREDLEKLLNCLPIERNLEFARLIAKLHPKWIQRFTNDENMLGSDAALCGLG